MPSRPRVRASKGRRRHPHKSLQEDLVELHRAIYTRQREEIDGAVASPGPGFRAYEEAYRRRVRGYTKAISYEEVVERAAAADTLFVGDYHTLPHAQRAFHKLLEQVLGRGRSLALGLEFVCSRHQRSLDAWIGGTLDEETFLRAINYPEHHVFRIWEGFRPIFRHARALGLPVLALDLESASLRARDTHAAEKIATFRRRHPKHQLLVLTGQLHVAPTHLPAALKRAMRAHHREAGEQLIIYQNAQEIYWQLTEQGLEHQVQAVEVSDAELCLVSTSPIVVQQSFLTHLHDDQAADVALESAPELTFKEMARSLASFLGVDLEEALAGVSVFSLGDLSFLTRLGRQKRFSRRELKYMREQILERESYYIPKARLVYLASLSMNHAAEEAAHFTRHVLSGDEGNRDGLVDAFYSRTLNEAIAFFGSKVINPRRKCLHRPRLERLVADTRTHRRGGPSKLERQAASLTLAHLSLEAGVRVPGVRKLYTETDADIFNGVTHLLGYQLGDRLYHAMVQGLFTKEEMRGLFLDPLDEEGDTFHAYFNLSERVRDVKIPPSA